MFILEENVLCGFVACSPWPVGSPLSEETGFADARLIVDIASGYFGCQDDLRVVDFGCGDGRVARYLLKYFSDLWLVDGSMTMLDMTAENVPDGQLVCSNGVDGALNGLGADLICMIDVLDSYFTTMGAKLLAGLANALKPQGLLVLNGPETLSVDRMAKDSGFEVVQAPVLGTRGLYVLRMI